MRIMSEETQQKTIKFNLDTKKSRADANKTSSNKVNANEIIGLLKSLLTLEIDSALRYKHHYFVAAEIFPKPTAAEFSVQAAEAFANAELIAERIVQLGGHPDFSPDTLLSSTSSDYVAYNQLNDMIKDNLLAELVMIDTYHSLISQIGDRDVSSRIILEKILAQEEEHANELSDWMSVA